MATYRAALKEARETFNRATKRLNEITYESAQLTNEIARLRRTITALAAMCSEEPMFDRLGITDACMEVMGVEKGTVSTSDVVKNLESMGFDLATQKNAQASVHAILSRLANKEVITKVTDEESNSVWWRGPNFDPSWDEVPF